MNGHSLQPALALLEGVVRAVDGDDVIIVIPVVVCVVGEAVAAHVDASVGVIVKRTSDVVTVPAALLKSIQSRSLYPVDKED